MRKRGRERERESVIINISSCEDVSVRVSDSAGARPSLLPPDVEYFTEEIILNISQPARADLHCQQQWCFYWSDNE